MNRAMLLGDKVKLGAARGLISPLSLFLHYLHFGLDKGSKSLITSFRGMKKDDREGLAWWRTWRLLLAKKPAKACSPCQ